MRIGQLLAGEFGIEIYGIIDGRSGQNVALSIDDISASPIESKCFTLLPTGDLGVVFVPVDLDDVEPESDQAVDQQGGKCDKEDSESMALDQGESFFLFDIENGGFLNSSLRLTR